MSAAAAKVSPTSSALSTGKHLTPTASSAGRVAWPIGTCHGLNSPHWPRMVTSIRQGARKAVGQAQRVDAVADAGGLHGDHGALAAEPAAGGDADALLLGGERDEAHAARSASIILSSCVRPPSGTVQTVAMSRAFISRKTSADQSVAVGAHAAL